MPNYLDLLTRRDPAQRPTTPVRLLVDADTYPTAHQAWQAATDAVAVADRRLTDARETDKTPPRRMNQASPVKQAELGLFEARETETETRHAVEACFLTAHLAAPTSRQLTQAAADTGDDQPGLYDRLLRVCCVRVTDHDGTEIPEITGDILADWMQTAPVGERMKIVRALDEAVSPIDYPTPPAS